jgi:hypothetical protein
VSRYLAKGERPHPPSHSCVLRALSVGDDTLERLTVTLARALRMNPPLPSAVNQRSLCRFDLLMTNSEPPQEPAEFSLVLGPSTEHWRTGRG